MPKAFVIDRCMFCGDLPCTCAKSTSRHPTKVQDTRRSAGPGAAQKTDQSLPDEIVTEAPAVPSPVESENVRPAPPTKSLKSMSTRPAVVPSSVAVSVPVDTEPADFGAARTASADADMERAIRVLREAGLIHPEDAHYSPEQRAAAWRAQRWRSRNVQ